MKYSGLLFYILSAHHNVGASAQIITKKIETRKLQTPEEQACLGALLYSGFSILDTAKYSNWFTNNSTMELAPAGVYTGLDNIREYVNFVFGPFADRYESSPEHQFVTVLSAEANKCEVFVTGINSIALSPKTTKGGKCEVEVSNTMHYTYVFTSPESAEISIEKVHIHFPEEFLTWFFTDQLNTPQTTAFVCTVLQNSCSDVYESNGFDGDESQIECQKYFDSVPLVEEFGNVRAFSQGCRKLHSAFANLNDDHCPHISFIPMEDLNGEIKCQDSSDSGRTYLDNFTTETLEMMKAKGAEHFGENIMFRELDNGLEVTKLPLSKKSKTKTKTKKNGKKSENVGKKG
eukprot:CAMPEP_0113317836 /NCGR_PEP_ID=MMETSP0010_2-20120614/12612_1 /TAXON_ID=216773 ORGANISM="Corethron hystrix, Strain 308" /NCGR_SAMPLE_ID=MMETSP0010_2 /ASSEMBLY_ACC=CAM_ASM_000155 /LENGTH=346 /DNA_ID=CAMNT_0000174951 /DNA_START=39 /DNA_END=1076 /DNA_ORIENTATION=+ /assembly_acc=CAM_ASM_000155